VSTLHVIRFSTSCGDCTPWQHGSFDPVHSLRSQNKMRFYWDAWSPSSRRATLSDFPVLPVSTAFPYGSSPPVCRYIEHGTWILTITTRDVRMQYQPNPVQDLGESFVPLHVIQIAFLPPSRFDSIYDPFCGSQGQYQTLLCHRYT
jgi:hypothetical protein